MALDGYAESSGRSKPFDLIKSKGFDRPLDSTSPSDAICHAFSSGNFVLFKSKSFDRPLGSASHLLRTRK